MGYTCYVSGDITLKDIAKDQDEVFKLLEDFQWLDFDISFCEPSAIEIRYDGNFHDDEWEDLLNDLVPYIREGCLDFSGEDNCFWRYQFNAEKQEWEELQGKIVYSDPKPIPKKGGNG